MNLFEKQRQRYDAMARGETRGDPDHDHVEGDRVVWRNPKPLGQGREESLLAVLYAVWEAECHPLYRQGFRHTREIVEAEREVERVQAEVLEGTAKIAEFRQACLRLKALIEANLIH